MKIGTLLLELLIVLAIILCLYHVYMKKSVVYNDKGEFITEDIKDVLNDVSSVSSVSDTDSNKEKKEEIEKKVNKLMKKYNIM